MTTRAVVQRSSASVETEIRSLVSQRSPIEGQQQRFSTRLLEIDAELERLKPLHFDGDATAGAAIDKLEIEKRDVARKIEGAEVRIRQFEEKIMPLRLELRSLKESDEAQDSRRQLEAFQSKLEGLVDARIATYRAACRALYQEAEFLHSQINLPSLNDAERALRLRGVEQAHKKLEAVNIEIVNGRWKGGPEFALSAWLTTLLVKWPPEKNGNGLQ